MSSICCKLSSYLPSFNKANVSRFMIGAGGLAAYCLAGPAAAAFTMLAGYAYSGTLSEPPQQKVAPIIKERFALEDHKQPFSGRKLDPSVYFIEPAGKAADIRNEGNSCAFSTVLWNLANMKEVLAELPLAILRRIDRISPLEGTIPDVLTISRLLSKREPLSGDDLNGLRRALENLEGFFTDASYSELLSLLQLHQLIREFQAAGQMQGGRVNALRKIISRVDPAFEATGVRMGDAHEIFFSLAELIFQNAHDRQRFHFLNGLGKPSYETNWGHLELPLQKGMSLADTLIEYLNGCEGQFDTAPPLLALNLKRNGFTYTEGKNGQWIPTVTKLFDPVIPNDHFYLGSNYFKDKSSVHYELIGVCRRLEDRAHYDAIWKRPDGQWYYGDDLDQVFRAKPPANPSGKASQVASQGYLFFYRKTK